MTSDEICTAVFSVLTAKALDKVPITYSDLGTAVGVHHRSPRLHSALGSIWEWCATQGLPHINALVVQKSGARRGIPGLGYAPDGHPVTRERWRVIQDEVYAYTRWDQLDPPKEWPRGYCGGAPG